MPEMPPGGEIDVVRAGARLKRKMLVALVLSSLVPVLVLAFVLLTVTLPGVVQLLVGVTIVVTLGGAWMVWDFGRIVARMGELLAGDGALSRPEQRQGGVDTLNASFKRMLATIEEQAAEINTFSTRLDSAYREMESTNARMKETAFKDDVTGLYNRRFLHLRLEEEIGRGRRFNHPLSLVVFELRGLQAVAETMGYDEYEDALRTFARVLGVPARSSPIVPARYDGSRFAALLVETPREGARGFVQQVRDAMATESALVRGMALSVGIASLPEDGPEAFAMIAKADAALRRSSSD
jgi:diguanylate cyclase (GGDEF)-like protein